MAEIVLSVFIAFILAITVMGINTVNENPFKLTLRGRRVLFVSALVVGYLFAQPVLHIQWDCDLRPNATTTQCKVNWIQAFV